MRTKVHDQPALKDFKPANRDCLSCRSFLQPIYRLVKAKQSVPECFGMQADATFEGKPILRWHIMTLHNGFRELWVWTGELGYRGNGYFCSRRCGYDYGIKAAKQRHGEPK